MILSNDKASGMPWLIPELPDDSDSLMDFCFSSPVNESRDEEAREGLRYVKE
jgi:hypothetical protein